MANYLLMPPGVAKTTPVNGRVYSCVPGATITVPDFDTPTLTANGWILVAMVGTTAQRPVKPTQNMLYHDMTLGYIIVWETSAWRNPNTGAAV